MEEHSASRAGFAGSVATMKIDVDVRSVATFFGADPVLLQAVVLAEGDIVRAARCS